MLPPAALSNNNVLAVRQHLDPVFVPALENTIAVAIPNVATSLAAVPAVISTTPTDNRPHPPPSFNDRPPPQEDQAAGTVITITMTPTLSPTDPTSTAIATGTPFSQTENPTECRLLGSFAILVQLALGGLALLSLVYKRWRERPQRPVKIWFFDASKQVFGSVLVHGANVFMSLLTSGRFNITTIAPPATVSEAARRGVLMLLRRDGTAAGTTVEGYVPNPCSFYLLNLAIDTTLGIPILILIVRVTTTLVTYTPLGQPPESVQSGHYGSPPNAWWWLKQSFIYFCGLMGMKLVVLVIFMIFPWISEVGDWALKWTEGNEKLQIVFVMMLFPLIMNAMQYYIIDSYIKKQEGKVEQDDAVYDEVEQEDDFLVGENSDSGDDESDGQRTPKATTRGQKNNKTRDPERNIEYDPDVDGDSQTVVGSSSSHISSRGVLTKDLLPKE
ncbi:vacuolar membrane protein-domain-containing protein [Triangularia setosa]|uniref:Vacuolar membrane protein-domain-containing protein n=1 Tax=Triangularia setosa TaxID=2587417 RepID=A0AAN7AD15_9PEZI|nr:vacuolar membrane protein-domain-containing protein [Podospora setosa]